MSAIAEHPDVARMLLTMQSLTGAARAVAYACAAASDRMRAEPEAGAFWRERANLLTPVAKAFATDIGVEVASLGIQVHGGMGFVEETGAARFLRDARIAPIYEGTNGIQAIDLVTRKLPSAEGATVEAYLAELDGLAEAVRGANREGLGRTAECLAEALADLRAATLFLGEAMAKGETETALAGATPYLRLFGLTAGAAYLAKGALADATGARDGLARFMAEDLLADTAALRRRVLFGAPSLLSAARGLAS